MEAPGVGDGSRQGLGYVRRGPKATGAAKRSTLKAITFEDEDGVTVTRYAYVKGEEATVVELSPRGRPVATGEVLELESSDLVREVVWWGEGVLGVAELTYPHPQGWTVEGAWDAPSLDKLNVRTLTAVFRRKIDGEPTCKAAWSRRLSGGLPWSAIGSLYQGGLLTPKDYSSHFKNILHRALLVRSRMPAADGSQKCRCCGGPTEHFVHLAGCPALVKYWVRLCKLAGLRASPKLVLLGAVSDREVMPKGLAALWLIFWKFVILAFTQTGIEGAAFNAEVAWLQAVRRFMVRVHASVHTYRVACVWAEGAGRQPPPASPLNLLLTPLARVSEQGELVWSPEMKAVIEDVGVELEGPTQPVSERPPLARPAPRPILFSAAGLLGGGAPLSSQAETQVMQAIADVPRYAWSVVRHVCAQRKGREVTVACKIVPDIGADGDPVITLVAPGEYLPSADGGPIEEEVCAAIRKATAQRGFFMFRRLLLVFEARDELEVAQRYARSMIESGIGELNDMMVARLPMAQDLLLKHIGEKAVRLEESCWALGGPKPIHRLTQQSTDQSHTGSTDLDLDIEAELEEMGGGVPPPPDL